MNRKKKKIDHTKEIERTKEFLRKKKKKEHTFHSEYPFLDL